MKRNPVGILLLGSRKYRKTRRNIAALQTAAIRALLAFIAVTVLATTFSLAAPSIESAVTSSYRPAKTITVKLQGAEISGATELWTSFPARAFRQPLPAGSAEKELVYQLFVPVDLPAGIGALRVGTTNGPSDLQLIVLDDLPPAAKSSANGTIANAQELSLPLVLDGVARERGFDYFKITAAKGMRLSVDVVANRIGSPFDPVLRLLDENGRELIYCDDAPGAGADAQFSHQFADAGTYFVELRDTRYQGGAKFFYRLRAGDFPLEPIAFLPAEHPAPIQLGRSDLSAVTESEPNDTISSAQELNRIPLRIEGGFSKIRDRDLYAIAARKDDRWIFESKTRSLGYSCDLFMQLMKADGSVVAEADVTGPNEAALTNKFNADGKYFLMVEELNRRGGPDLNYELQISRHTAGFDLSVETDTVAAGPGGTFELKVDCARRDYNGPIDLRLEGLNDAFEISNASLGEKTNSVALKVTVSADLPPGRLMHFTVVGSAQIGDQTVAETASTMPALRKQFPLMLYPPAQIDGLIALGIKAASGK